MRCTSAFTDWTAARLWERLQHAFLNQLGEAAAIAWSRAVVDAISVRAEKGRRDVVEKDEYAAFTRRVVHAYSRRVGRWRHRSPRLSMVTLAADVETAIQTAVIGLRAFGYSWTEIATRLGISR